MTLSRSVALVGTIAPLLLATATARAHTPVGSDGAPIVDGTAEPGAPAVVALASTLGTVSCTGTLVSPRVVLTAAHCLDAWTDLAFLGTDPAADGVFIEVAAQEAHPQLDVAVVVLARPAPILPAPLPDRPLEDADLGRELTFIGFGTAAAGDLSSMGIKRRATAALESVGIESLGYRRVTCHGDSGGPALLDGRLVGVTSRGDAACAAEATSVRVDVIASWLGDAVARHDPAVCNLDQRCVVAACSTPDPDCQLEPSSTAAEATQGPGGCALVGAPGGDSGAVAVASFALLLLASQGRRRRRAALCAGVLAVSGCSDGPEGSGAVPAARLCAERFVGDPELAATVEVFARDRAGSVDVGVSVDNMDGCAIALRARLFAPDPGGLLEEVGAFVQVTAEPPAAGLPAFAGHVALPAPPQAGPYIVVAAAEDALGRGATAEAWVWLHGEAP
jgi:hypothetical protein